MHDTAQRPARCALIALDGRGTVAPANELVMSARTRARGDWELSAKKRSETEGAGNSSRSNKPPASDRSGRKPRSGDLGRALRSVYDDTLRETVPDDFLNLLGKLS
jgi:hypothetical protein